MTASRLPLVVLVGPTAVGKTELALILAERSHAEIVSADSRLFHTGMDIGTAKPTREERARVPHHLIDIAMPDEVVGLAVFQKLARTAIAEIHAKNKLPLLVGGSGQYIRAVTEGWSPPSVAPQARLRAALDKLGASHNPKWLHAWLDVLDAESARTIDARNRRRVVRALEVILTSGRKFSEQRGKQSSPYHLITLGLTRTRTQLYERVDARIESMFAHGFLDEVRALLARGYLPNLPSMSAIGYRECFSVLRGESSTEAAKSQIRRATRIFVRRQANWFKESDPKIRWFDADQPELAQQAEDYVRASM